MGVLPGRRTRRARAKGGSPDACHSQLRIAITAALLMLAGRHLPAQTTPAIRFTDATLSNGLRVIISEDHAAPAYSISVHYKVGSKDECAGRTGFAHLTASR